MLVCCLHFSPEPLLTDQSYMSLGYFSQDVSPCTAVTVSDLQSAYRNQRALSLAVNVSVDSENLLLSEGDEELEFSSSNSCFSADSMLFSGGTHVASENCNAPVDALASQQREQQVYKNVNDVSACKCRKELYEYENVKERSLCECKKANSRNAKLRRQHSIRSGTTAACCAVSHQDIFSVDLYHNEEDDVRLEKSLIPSTLATPHKQKLVTSIKNYTPEVNKKPSCFNVIGTVEERRGSGEMYCARPSTNSEFPAQNRGLRQRLDSALHTFKTRWESTECTKTMATVSHNEDRNLPQPNAANQTYNRLPTHTEYDISPAFRSIHSSSSSSRLLSTKPRYSKEAYMRSISLTSQSDRTGNVKKRNILCRLFNSFSRFHLSSRQSSRDNVSDSPDQHAELEAKGITLALI